VFFTPDENALVDLKSRCRTYVVVDRDTRWKYSTDCAAATGKVRKWDWTEERDGVALRFEADDIASGGGHAGSRREIRYPFDLAA
jgi:hypothetical protein